MAELESQLKLYLGKIDRDIEDLGLNPNFDDGVDSLYRDSNTVALLALAVALSAEDSAMKGRAAGILAVAQNLSAVKNLPDAKLAAESLKAASVAEGTSGSEPLGWRKVAHLPPLMKKALPNISTEIKRLGRDAKTIQRGNNLDRILGNTATLVVIAVGCRPNVDETLAPTEEAKWLEYCDRLYEVTRDLNRKARALSDGGSFEEFNAAFKAFDATCNTTCHATFGGGTP